MLLNEDSLQSGDLRDLVKHVFEVDNYRSKMGDDKDIVVLSFTVEHRAPAEDLVNFIEKGYQFVLDADMTPGELSDGKYRVFVEMQRTSKVAEQINDLLYGVRKLTGVEQFKFRYHKSFDSKIADLNTLSETIPSDPNTYEFVISERRMESYENFFSKSMLEKITMSEDDVLTVKKIYAEPLRLRVLKQGKKEEIINSIEEGINVNDWGEVIYLIKYLGDYDITKFGNKIVLANEDHAVVMERL